MERSTANRIVGDGLLQSKMHSLAGQRLTDHPHLVGRRGVLFTTCHFINPKACHPEPSEGSLTVSLADTENIQRWKARPRRLRRLRYGFALTEPYKMAWLLNRAEIPTTSARVTLRHQSNPRTRRAKVVVRANGPATCCCRDNSRIHRLDYRPPHR